MLQIQDLNFVVVDQYGNDDYAQLERWPGHAAYKSATADSSSLIYTSDYGSYSSQESNHSGTTCMCSIYPFLTGPIYNLVE